MASRGSPLLAVTLHRFLLGTFIEDSVVYGVESSSRATLMRARPPQLCIHPGEKIWLGSGFDRWGGRRRRSGAGGGGDRPRRCDHADGASLHSRKRRPFRAIRSHDRRSDLRQRLAWSYAAFITAAASRRQACWAMRGSGLSATPAAAG